MRVDFPIFGDLNKRQDLAFDAQDLQNLFLVSDPEGKKKLAFLSSPGMELRVEVSGGSSQSRALLAFDNELFGVFGSAFYSFDTDLIATFVDNIDTSVGLVTLVANNGGQIITADGVSGYIYDIAGGTLTKITDPGFPAQPLNVAYLDGYFVIPSGESRQFQISALNNGLLWDALDEAQIQAYPGFNVGVGVVNRRLYFFKTDTTEVWYNAGAADFPFRRDNNLLFNYGCLTASSIVSDFGLLFWLSRDKGGVGSFMMTAGAIPKRVSDDSIDDLIGTFTYPERMSAYVYKDDGHIFYVANWTDDDYTLVYDVSMDKWTRWRAESHKFVSGQPSSAKTRHLGNCHAYFLNQHLVGSYKEPILYDLSRDYPDSAGQPIWRRRVSQTFFDPSYHMLQINYLQIDMEMGIGNASGNYTDPQIFLSISRDGGHRFGNRRPAAIGAIGKSRTRAMFRKLGLARSFVADLSIYASVAPIVILGAAIDYKVLSK